MTFSIVFGLRVIALRVRDSLVAQRRSISLLNYAIDQLSWFVRVSKLGFIESVLYHIDYSVGYHLPSPSKGRVCGENSGKAFALDFMVFVPSVAK